MTKAIELCGGKYLYMCDYNRIINAETKDLFLANEQNQRMTVTDIDITEEFLRRKFQDLPQMIFEIPENYCNYQKRGTLRNLERNIRYREEGLIT